MNLTSGAKLGPYEILAPLGAGGMGEVYRARDTRLDREVAIKVLPDSMTRDADRIARFEREAKVLASLNHSNIGAIHGFETAEARKFLVLEYVEGETLAQPGQRGELAARRRARPGLDQLGDRRKTRRPRIAQPLKGSRCAVLFGQMGPLQGPKCGV